MGESRSLMVIRSLSVGLVIVAVAAGAYARFYDLGDRILATDEYYTVRAAQFILSNGLPEYPAGGYYLRALTQNYLTAASELLLGPTGFAYRLPSALFSLGSVVLAYLYCRRFMGRPVAAAVAVTLLLSSWDIEFARFARMYSLFQFFTLAFLLSYDEAFFGDRWRLRYLPHVFAVLTVLTHSLGIFLLPFLFVALIGDKAAKRFPSWPHWVRFAAAGVATIALCYAYLRSGIDQRGVVDPLPDDYVATAAAGFQTPAFPFWTIGSDPFVNLVFVLGLLAGATLILWAAKMSGRDVRDTDILVTLSVIAAATHFLAVLGLLLAILLFRYQIQRVSRHPRRTYAGLALSLLIAAAWLGYALSDMSWTSRVDGGAFGLVWSLRRTFFGWPDLYTLHYLPWARELPEIGAMVAAALAYMAAVRLRDPLPDLLRHPAIVVILVALLMSVFSHEAPTVRYANFMYPIMLCALALAIKDLASRAMRVVGAGDEPRPALIGSAIYLGVFAWSSDFNPGHIANVTSERVNFRLGEFARFESVWYPRRDFETPATFVNERLGEDENAQVIVLAPHTVLHYLHGDWALYFDRDSSLFPQFSRGKGTVDAWTGGRLLGTYDAVRDYTKTAQVIWLIRFKPWAPYHPFPIEEVWRGRLLSHSLEFESRDGRLEVLRLRLSDGA